MAPPISANFTKLKTNLRLSIQRLRLLGKKKTELTQKSRTEIGSYIFTGKIDRARIRVEHIIREDYLVEAFEMLEMYCDLLLTRFGMIEQMRTVDEGLVEAISSIIWASHKIEGCPELKVVADLLSKKYGKQFAIAARDNSLGRVNKKLLHRLGVEIPPKVLVEKYLVEISKSMDLAYEPDPTILNANNLNIMDKFLLDLETNDPNPPLIPSIPPNSSPSSTIPDELAVSTSNGNKINPQELDNNILSLNDDVDDIENFLPEVPSSLPELPSQKDFNQQETVKLKTDLDFEELTKRFEALKKSK
ncbi:IST1 homolog [Tetranychus urticae]|uniref:IST1 homolog n=1 Tax=Tetranychus urticae TaxID=32264 RepID=T1JW92_TETUR|nr:IST1 homolog [Tetranychus urticae]